MISDHSFNPLLVQELFLSPLCIDSKYLQAVSMSAYLAYSSNKPLDNSKYVKSYFVNPKSGYVVEQASTPGSVGVVVIDGPIVSASDPWYGIKGTIEAAQELLANDADPNLVGQVLYLNTGGGAVYAIKPIGDVLTSLTKPVVTFSKEILASAGYRIAANTDHIMMYHPQGIVGSLGTMYSISDMQPMFEKWGIKFYEYYATASSMKNKTFTTAREGDGTAVIEHMLNPMNDLFISDIKAMRGDKISTEVKEIYQGETYFADPQGLQYGLVDSIGNLADAVAKVVELANGESTSSINQSFIKSNTMFGLFEKTESKFPALTALAGLAPEAITPALVEAVNKEIVAEKIPGVTLALDSSLTIAANAVKENGAALAAINAILGTNHAKSNLTEALAAYSAAAGQTATSLQAVTAERDSWKAKAVEYGAQAADVPTSTLQTETDKIPGTESKSSFYSEADAELEAAMATMKKLPGKK